MNDHFVEWRKKENIRPLSLPNKVKFYYDIQNIEHSFSGRIGEGGVVNTFVMEAAQQLINAIELFEAGYFDCAYYSLRSAVDVSTTMVFLSDMPEEEREEKYNSWKNTKDFPMQHEMVRSLSRLGYVFSDMIKKMPAFFDEAKILSQRLNKYVHKQGLQHFYVSRNHSINQAKPQDVFIHNFEFYIKKCIGIVAVMRLAADPFPILLMDEDILYRCFDSLTEPYSQSFVDEYIGDETINAYKCTDIYQGTYESFIKDEKKTQATFDVMKYQYIDTQKLDEILQQIHLLSLHDAICIFVVKTCEKITKVYALNGFYMYFTDRNTNRKETSWSGIDFMKFEKSPQKHNQEYGEAYISVFFFKDEAYFAEHNDPLSIEEIESISNEIDRCGGSFPSLFDTSSC